MTKQTILFDMDDTLIHCNKYFDLVAEQFADQMETWFHGYHLSIDEVKKKQSEIDLERVLVSGFAPDHFPQSFVDTYEYYLNLTGRPRSEQEIERLRELGASVYGHGIEPYPHMEETLRTLQAEGHELHLYTGGEPTIQMRKVTEAGLQRFFATRIHITRHKNAEFLESLIRTNGWDRKVTWMIGNSMRTDINPALKCGINAIFMPAEQEWAYNQVELETEPAGAYFTLPSLNAIPDAIRSYTEPKAAASG
ncbi:HAD family hydrolase [Paenibacillus mucilaginosus]|uniref:Haloacid dehalogenase domain-containing protein hydrolase n=3 Tax=Paenibacillus mucilaginosus TaxID=61624 RepID=H6NQP9_9BACL|nr:HAD hydrolase-like protein [Paenibacillus mucilaginosus]AEI45868.1 Haloacid dehalogenase domain protein hydrolase [Paenibacillus mucilaginosus KNP414]AFC33517.1 Haloacid dehalogenase domain-containing protein hydrolase [Paenibacillus mucilaginosus 3016]AFH65838.1 HAD family hydrolase [Paenibacillus mucilaginosus K02]MCG7217794.1 HAD hydrolase-like protein [Paenibacillus mucilaginosus]WDM27234.1 HAD hydrolase-like protein [Paenibacillus mucilaginosus]